MFNISEQTKNTNKGIFMSIFKILIVFCVCEAKSN